MSRFLKGKFEKLNVYVPGEQPQDMTYIKLNTNESPYPPSPEVLAAVSEAEVSRLNLYPDPEMKALKGIIADKNGLKPENIFLSNGSDDILNFAFMLYGSMGEKVYFPDITYGFYRVFGDLHQSQCVEIPLTENFEINIEDYFKKDGLIIIANPNAPTGRYLSLDKIQKIIEENPDNIVLVDEAYIDFGGESATGFIKKYDNLIVSQTFSKSRSMAGARLGFAFASEEIIRDFEKIKYSTNPYNINRLTAIAGCATMESEEYYREKCGEIIKTREETTKKLEKEGFTVIPSKANFVFAKHNFVSGDYIYKKLKENGVLVRHYTEERIADYNRITIGTPEQMETLYNKLKLICERKGD